MSSMLVCDVCGKPLERPFFKMRLTKHETDQESRDARTVGAIDMHEACLKVLKDWMHQNRMKEMSR